MWLTSGPTFDPQPNASDQLAVSLRGKKEKLSAIYHTEGGQRQIQAAGIWAKRANNEPPQTLGVTSLISYTSFIHSIWPSNTLRHPPPPPAPPRKGING